MSHSNKTTRRSFLQRAAVSAAAAWSATFRHAAGKTTQTEPDGFFTVRRQQGRWWFVTPQRKPFFSLGLNHIDPATLRYPENRQVWEQKYANSMRRWLQEAVRKDLLKWGFNTVGWTQEVVTRGQTNHRHSRRFTFEEYQWLDMPYCHLLPFAEFHQWEAETRHPDFFSAEWEAWCDHVAREHCAVLAGDPKLIGYFYIDCPTWVHVRPMNEWKGPLFDPEKLESAAGRKELLELAGRYYRVTHDAIRRYDKHHLILGDRYEANAPLPMEVVEAARPYVDVLSFQDFRDPAGHLADWHEATGMPVLWADGAHGVSQPGGWSRNDGRFYREVLARLRDNAGCVGAHLCGAYLRNRVRRRGLLDEQERPDTEMIELIAQANRETAAWVERVAAASGEP